MDRIFKQVLNWLSPAVIAAALAAAKAEARKTANPFDDIVIAFIAFWVGKNSE